MAKKEENLWELPLDSETFPALYRGYGALFCTLYRMLCRALHGTLVGADQAHADSSDALFASQNLSRPSRGALGPYLLYGPAGVGKKTMVQWLACALEATLPLQNLSPLMLPRSWEGWKEAYIHRGNNRHPGWLFLPTAPSVDQVRAFIRRLEHTSQGPRIALLANVHALSSQSANALLKSLEYPWPGTVFFLTASASPMATLRSRCMAYSMMPLPPETFSIVSALSLGGLDGQEQVGAGGLCPDDVIENAAGNADGRCAAGSPGDSCALIRHMAQGCLGPLRSLAPHEEVLWKIWRFFDMHVGAGSKSGFRGELGACNSLYALGGPCITWILEHGPLFKNLLILWLHGVLMHLDTPSAVQGGQALQGRVHEMFVAQETYHLNPMVTYECMCADIRGFLTRTPQGS